MSSVSIDEKGFILLKKEYKKAVSEGRKSFIFKGNEVLTSYAKYLIEYLEGKFNPSNKSK
jgi:hypothetical protein